jgi:serine/threonine protein kinase
MQEKTRLHSESTKETYIIDRLIGSGSFGSVYLATDADTGSIVAIKKVLQDRRFKNRELAILQQLDHPHIVNLLSAFFVKSGEEQNLFMVMEYVPETLARIIRQYNKAKQHMPLVLVKLYTYQMVRALLYLHHLGIATRDCKPQNVLIDPKTHVVKLCDMGSSKILKPGEANVAYICSRFYRAPELIFAATEYTCAIDMWSLGAVLGEMINGVPMFPGESSVDQLVEIIKVLGTPSHEQILAMNPNYTEFKFPQVKAQPIARLFKTRNAPEAMEMLTGMLQYDPEMRLTARDALVHKYFDELRAAARSNVIPGAGNKAIPESLFTFNHAEQTALGPDLIDKLIAKTF